MKKELLKVALIVMALFSSFSYVSAQIGPVTSISERASSLPETITKFLNSYYPGIEVTEVELETFKNIYDVELINGVDLKFHSKTGEWREIDAPDHMSLHKNMLYDILPSSIYNYIDSNMLVNKINEVEYKPQMGYKIETIRGRDIYFNLNGKKISKPSMW